MVWTPVPHAQHLDLAPRTQVTDREQPHVAALPGGALPALEEAKHHDEQAEHRHQGGADLPVGRARGARVPASITAPA